MITVGHNQMPAALDVNKEEVRMLVLAVGVREAARQMGINEKTVLHWSHTGSWLASTRAQPASLPRPASQVPRSVVSVVPAKALENVLKERQNHTKLGLSLYAARASRVASRIPKHELLEHAPSVKAIADIAAKVWPEQGIPSMRISMFGSSGIDVESLPEAHVTLEMPADPPPDDY